MKPTLCAGRLNGRETEVNVGTVEIKEIFV